MMGLVPERCRADDARLAGVLALIRESFAGMEGRIDPPSSMHRLTADVVVRQAEEGEIWICGNAPIACVFLEPKGGFLYLSKLAVARTYRGMGFARRLVDLAETRAEAHGLEGLELKTRIELTENHAAFRKLGFVVTGETCHPGFDRPTSLTMRKLLPDAEA